MTSSSSKRWLERQERDHYVKKAQQSAWRSRAAFKLIQILEQDPGLLPRQGVMVDLGSAPGGWSQVLAEQNKTQQGIVALDILAMDPVAGVDFIQGDFTSDAVYEALCQKLEGTKVSLIVSDMAPNLSGNKVVDQASMMHLIDLAYGFAEEYLAPGGHFVAKFFQGAGSDQWLKTLRGAFEKVRIKKPDASRNESSEQYVIAKNFKG